MVLEIIFITLGALTLLYVFAVVWQVYTTREVTLVDDPNHDPIVPVNLVDNHNAVVVSEGRGRLVYANDNARQWFGMNGDEPNMITMAGYVSPRDSFIDVFAAEGRSEFRIGKRQIEATSYRIPNNEGERRMVVVMRELQNGVGVDDVDFESLHAINLVGEVNDLLGRGRSTELEETFRLILQNINTTVSFDYGEINLWEAEKNILRPIQRAGDPNYIATMEDIGGVYALDEGYSGWIARYRQPIIVEDVYNDSNKVKLAVADYPFSSYLGVPLLVGERFLGTLELANREAQAFDFQDLSLLQSLAGQIGVALENSRLYQDQINRLAEMQGLQQISQAMGFLSTPQDMYARLNESLSALIHVQACGILLLNTNETYLEAQPPLYGLQDPLVPFFKLPVQEGIGREIWEERDWWFTNDAFNDPEVEALGLNGLVDISRLRSLAILPMMLGNRRLGMVMAGNTETGTMFAEKDMANFSVFVSEVAIVVENARLYSQEQRRAEELEGLQQIAQAIGSMREPQALYEQVTTRIAELLNVEQCGIWLFRSVSHSLSPQAPFYGVVDDITHHHLPISDNRELDDRWESAESWFINGVQQADDSGSTLRTIAKAFGMRDMAFAPLVFAGEKIGVLQVANKDKNTPFINDDLEILTLFAGQAAVMINNASLYQETHRRAVEADNLRKISEELSLSLELDAVVDNVLQQTAELLECQGVGIGMLDTQVGKLVYESRYRYGTPDVSEDVVMDIFSEGFTNSVALSRNVFVSDLVDTDKRILPAYLDAAKLLGVESVIIVPLVVQNQSAGEILAFNKQAGGFTDNDQSMLQAISSQIAASIERSRLYLSTDEDLRSRVDELDALDRLGQALAETLDSKQILEITQSEVARSMGGEPVTIATLLPKDDWLNPEIPLIDMRVGGPTRLQGRLAPIEISALKGESSIMLSDYLGSDLLAYPEGARAAIVERMVSEGNVLGLLHVYSQTPNIFTVKQQAFLARVAKQTALALTNARRYQQQLRLNDVLQARTNQMSKIYGWGHMLHEGASLEAVLFDFVKSLSDSIGYLRVLVRLVNDNTELLEPVAYLGITQSELDKINETTITREAAEGLLEDRWKIGESSYFLPAEDQDEFAFISVEQSSTNITVDAQNARMWHTDDGFISPLRSDDGQLIGWISLDRPRDGMRPNRNVAETLEIFATEASFTIENYRLLDRIREESAGRKAERDRLALLHLVAKDMQKSLDMRSRLQAVVDGIQSVGWDKVRLSLRNATDNYERTLTVFAGYDQEEQSRYTSMALPGGVWQRRLEDDGFLALNIGEVYYMRYDEPWVKENILGGRKPDPESVPENEWHPQDVIYLPMYNQNRTQLMGIITMESPHDGSRPTEDSLQAIELFALQAAAIIENTRLYEEIIEQQQTERRLTEMMESVAASLDMERVLQTLAEGLQQMIAFTRMHLALPNDERTSFNLRRVEVTADQRVHILDDEPIAFENTALAQSYKNNENLLYHLKTDEATGKLADLSRWSSQGERTTLMVPMVAGGETLGVLRLGSELENAFGFEERQDLVSRMANLSAVSINHARLLSDLRASTAYNEAVVESIQQGIIVLDTDHKIQILNTFMKQRYGWADEAVGQSLYAYETSFENSLKKSIALALDDGTPHHEFEVQGTDRFGSPLIRNFYVYPLRQEQDENISGVVLLLEDVTERAILESNLAQRAEQLSALTRVSSQMTSTLETEEVVSLVLEALENVMPYDGVTLWLREGTQLKVSAARGFADEGTATPEELLGLFADIESSELFRDIANRQDVLNVGDTGADDPRFPYGAERVYKNWMGAPLVSQGAVVGVIALEKIEPYFYDTNHEQLLQAFANQASVALRNAQLFEQTMSRASELNSQTQRLELLNRVAVSLSQSLDIENIFETTLRETALALEVKEAVALKLDYEKMIGRVVVEFPRGDEEPSEVFDLSDNKLTKRLEETLLPISIDVIEQSQFADDVKTWLRREDIKGTLVVPLVVGGTMTGLMRFDNTGNDPYFFSQERIEIAQTLASQAAIAVQNASLFEQSVMRTHELETLFEASQATAVTLDLDEAMRRVVKQMMGALRADYCTIALWDDVENRLEVREAMSAWGDAPDVGMHGEIYNLMDYPLRRQALRQREVMQINVTTPELDQKERELMESNGVTDRLFVPLVVNDYSIGLIDLEIREQNRVFETADIRLARTLAAQSAVAIENARLQTETRSQIEELYIINDLSTAVSSKMNMQELFPMLENQLPFLTDADYFYLSLYDKDTKQITFPVSIDDMGNTVDMKDLTIGDDEFSYVINRKAPLLLAGTQLKEARDSYGINTIFPEAKCFLAVPMVVGEEVLGVLGVRDDNNDRAFWLNDQRILTTVASQLAVAIQNARLFDRTQRFAEDLENRVDERTAELTAERERMQTLYDITREISSSLDVSRVLDRALARVATAVNATSAVMMGVDEISEQLYVLETYGGMPVNKSSERTKLKQGQGLAGWIFEHRQNVIIPDVQKDDRWHVSNERDEVQRSCVAALLEVGEDSRGVMMLFSDQVNAFDDNHLKLVTAAASQLASSMSNGELYSLIREQAERLGAILRQEQVESTKNNAIMDSIADGVMYADETGTIKVFNTASERILELPTSTVLNRSIRELAGLYGGSTGAWMNAIERWIENPESYQEGDVVEESIELTESGRIVSIRLAPVLMGDQFLGTVSIFRDITKIVEVDRLKSEFVATVSHELRTPMTSIKGYSDLLLLGAAGEISEAQQRFLETIKQNADRLSVLVNDLLEVSRIDQDRVPLRFTGVDVAELMNSISAHLEGRAEDQSRELNIKIEVPDALPKIRADYDRVIQIMQNLADNAFNYTSENGKIILKAEYKADDDAIMLSVEDDGVGIPKEIQPRVFERFFRGDEYHDLVLDTPGTGLGLSIVKSLVEMHDGKIWLESEKDEGTTFYVQLPIDKE